MTKPQIAEAPQTVELSNEFVERIKALPGENGWWKGRGFSTYLSLSKKLLSQGFTEDEAYSILEKSFWVGANEYGG